jgi:hypothetical protein
VATDVPEKPPPGAGTVYGPLLADALDAEMAQKASIEQRGLAVITTSGVLVSLLVALSALLLGKDYNFLDAGTKTLLILAVAAFVAAAGLGLATNAPRRYWGLSEEDLERISAPDSWLGDADEAALVVAQQRAAELGHAKRANERKARLLLTALGVEVIGVGLVAAALVVAFVS